MKRIVSLKHGEQKIPWIWAYKVMLDLNFLGGMGLEPAGHHCIIKLGMEGLEPTRPEGHRILSPVRLPFRHMPSSEKGIQRESETACFNPCVDTLSTLLFGRNCTLSKASNNLSSITWR